jgi:short-subunit dehydrogenase
MKTKKETVLITGATSGIGYDFATIFAEKGYDLFLASRNREKLDDIKVSFEKQYDIPVMIMPIDLSKEKSAKNVYDETLKQNAEINILINNAGFGIQGEHIDLEMSKVQAMIQLNITTLTELCALFGKDMKKRRKGYILNVASTAAYQPAPYFAAYAATKSYVLSFSEALAKEMEELQVVVTCLSPGATSTNFFNYAGVGDKKKGLMANSSRMQSRDVAMIGVNALFSKKLSVISGLKNSFLAFTNRFVSRKMAANISKILIRNAVNS